MRSQIRLGKVFGIQIGLHYSWFLIALLIVFSLFGQFHSSHAQWSTATIFTMALATAVLFFGSLLLHELSHALMATARGIPVREITLFALGGVSQMEGEAPDAKSEFWIAIVGPATSVVIGLVCVGLAGVAGPAALNPLVAMFSLLGYINLALAVFNLVPGYPLDGGRILRSVLWWKSGDMERATRLAAKIGQAVAGAFIALGIVEFFSGAGIGGLWIAFIGWFLLQAAKESYLQIGLKHVLEGVRVGDLMTHDCGVVSGGLSVQDLVDDELLRTGQRCFFVADNGGVGGIVTLNEIKQVARPQWPFTRLREIMIPPERLRTVTPSTSIASALELMARNDLNQLPVVSDGHLDGVVSRGEILGYLQTRAELQA
jgi:Zn-dependent protease/predicted transcriptional regulator